MDTLSSKAVRWLLSFIISSIYLNYPNISIAWNQTGHQLISQIACNELSNQELKKLDIKLDKLIAKLSYNDKKYYNNQPYSLCKLAKLSSLPDRWKNQEFINLARSLYITDPALTNELGKQKTYDWHFKAYKQEYLNNPGQLDSVVIKLNNNIKKTHSEEGWALGMIFLSHLTEDAHQPLHSMSKTINRKFKINDKGGNLYCLKVKSKDTCKFSLHTYWDNAGGLLTRKKDLLLLTQNITQNYTKQFFKNAYKELSPDTWLKESYSYKTIVYNTSINKMPNHLYQMQTQNIAKHRLALSGYRLSEIIRSLL